MPSLSGQTAESQTTRLSFKKKLLFTLIPILIFLGCAEIALRTTVGLKQLRYKCHYPLLDNQYCPNMTATHETTGKTIRTNSVGLLDREYDKTAPPGTFRVAVLGDSFAAGEEVEDGSEFHALWEKALPEQLGFPVEFINFGAGGIGPWRELQTYHLRAREYKPDLTVLAFFWENDFDNSYNKFMRGEPNPLKEEYPVTSFSQEMQITRKRFNQWLWNNVALYQFIHTRYPILEKRVLQWFQPDWRKNPDQFEDEEKKPTVASVENTEATIDNKLLKKYPALPGVPPRSRPTINTPTSLDDPWFFDSDAWQLVREILLKLKQEVETDGGRLVVMHFMSKVQYRERHPLPRKEFNAFLKANQIGVIDPNPHFLKMTEKTLHSLYIPEDGHFNETGQAKLAQISIPHLEQTIRAMRASSN